MPVGNEKNNVKDGLTIRGGFAIESRPGLVTYVSDAGVTLGLPGLMAPVHPGLSQIAVTMGGVNGCRACRVVAPRSGTLTGLTVYISATSGNIDVGVYDTSATTRNRLASAGTTAAGTANTWQTLPFTAPITVQGGEQYDFVFSADNTTVSLTAPTGMANSAVSSLPAAFLPATLGGVPRLSWSQANGMFPLPTTTPEASLANTTGVPIILGNVV